MPNQNDLSLPRDRDKATTENFTYWQKEIGDLAPFIDFPNDRDRSIATSTTHTAIPLAISAELYRGLETVANSAKADLELVLLSAYYVLLDRYSNQTKLTIGYLSPKKDTLSSENLLIIPLCLDIQSEKYSYFDLLDSIQNALLTAKKYPIDSKQLASIFQTSELESSRLPWEQMLFCPNQELSPTSLHKRELLLKFDSDSSQVSLEFDADLFLPATRQRIIANYQRLLEDIVACPDIPIDRLSLLTEAEKDLVLNQWNQTQVELELRSIVEMFETRVAQAPDAIALRCQQQQLTYVELNQKANQVARYLQTLGVGKRSLVGLYLERSLDLVVGVLGILKTGAGYVPLDRENPTERLAYILKDSQIKVLLTQNELEDKLPPTANTISLVYLDRDWHLIEQESLDNLNLEIVPEDLAHIVYTSGSTGKPKGVKISHGNLSHYAHSLKIALNITPADVYLHRGSIALIVSARQLLMPLAQGAAVSILTTADKKDPLKMFEGIKNHGVTIVDRVPSFWRNFSGILDSLNQERRDSLMDNQVRLVAAGGEQVSVEIYQCWRRLFKPEVQLANIYGQTEGTGVVTIYYIPQQIDTRVKSLPVGSPIPNMRVYVLDKNLQPVPIGVTGEIHISGAGVAQGYLNRAQLTAEKFIANPYVPNAQLYKTGDLGRFLANGTIQFLGRSDRQVNINGLRIELGEIETTLVQHPQILESAVVVQNNNLGETLIAYLVPSQNPPSIEAIRQFLLEKLPKYMLPTNFIFCDSFPLTTSGKIDRKTLATNHSIDRDTNYVAPRNQFESEVIDLLEKILGIEKISIKDDFIELGGNSLIAARLVTEIETKYQRVIPISSIFQSSTPEALAKLVSQEDRVSFPECFIPIKQGDRTFRLFGIHNLGYGLELYRPLAKYLNPNISLCGLSSFFSNQSDLPHPRDIEGLASYYAEQIQLVQPQGPYYIMGVSFGGVIAYELAQRLVAQQQEVKFLGLVDTFLPDRNSIFKTNSWKLKISGHFNQMRAKGVTHILDRIKWRMGATADNARANLYQIDWISKNLVDTTSRNFAQAAYLQQRREHQQVNRNYVIQPYSGHVNLFRATDDLNPKLEWQELARSGLSTYDVPGEHLEILKEPNVQILAQKLSIAIENQ